MLTDLDRYAEWNPFVVQAQGRAEVGERLRLRIQPVGGRAMSFRPRVTAAEPGRRLVWHGRLWGVPGLFHGVHRFDLRPSAVGTLVEHGEDFSGVLLPVIRSSLREGSLAGFEAMNTALAARVAALPGGRP